MCRLAFAMVVLAVASGCASLPERLERGERHFEARSWSQAEHAYKSVLREDYNNIRAHLRLAEIYCIRDRADLRAAFHLREAERKLKKYGTDVDREEFRRVREFILTRSLLGR